MTPARAQLEGIVGALRAKQLVAIAITALVEMLLVAAVVYALVRLGLPNLVLSRSRRLVLALGMLLVFVAALLLEQARQARSMLYLAKRIDSENALDDHLVSALSFVDPVVSPFERACVDALMMRLQTQQLRVPEVKLERVWLLFPAVLIAGATGFVDYRRASRPQDDGRATVTLPDNLRERISRVEKVELAAGGKIDPTLEKQVQETRRALESLVSKSATKESVISTVSRERDRLAQYERDNPSLADAAMQLGDPATQRASDLATALKSGQPAPVNRALQSVIDAISGKQPPVLNEQERQEIRGILEQLQKAATQPALKQQLENAARSMTDMSKANTEAAGQALRELRQPLLEQLTREAAARQLTQSLKGALAEVQRQADLQVRKLQPSTGTTPKSGSTSPADGGASGATAGAPGTPDGPDDTGGGLEDDPSGGGGAGTARGSEPGRGSPEEPISGRDVAVSSPWTQAPVKQLVAAGASSSPGEAREATRAIFAANERSLEREVRREEIPAEYAQSIRRYFFNLQRDWEQKWKPSK